MPADINDLDPVVKPRDDTGGVTGYSLLVTRVSPFAEASGDKSPPPVARGATPPARNPPTQTGFARGPGAVGIHTTDATNY